MSQSFIFRPGCWIYTKRIERENVKFILQYLGEKKTATLNQVALAKKQKSKHSLRHAAYYLIMAGVVDIKQKGEARILSLNKNWIGRFKAMTTPYSKLW